MEEKIGIGFDSKNEGRNGSRLETKISLGFEQTTAQSSPIEPKA